MQANPEQEHRKQIEVKLGRLLQDLSGLSAAELDPSASFLELGFDSLFLTQFTQSVSSEFKVKVTFRQMMDELGSLNQLAVFLATYLPIAALLGHWPFR